MADHHLVEYAELLAAERTLAGVAVGPPRRRHIVGRVMADQPLPARGLERQMQHVMREVDGLRCISLSQARVGALDLWTVQFAELDATERRLDAQTDRRLVGLVRP